MLTVEQIEQYRCCGFGNGGPVIEDDVITTLQSEVLRVIDDRENAACPQPV